MKKLLHAAGLLLLISPIASLQAQECTDLNVEIVTAVIERVPCPESAEDYNRFERRIGRNLQLLSKRLRSLHKALRIADPLDRGLIVEQLKEYRDACRESLGIPEVQPPAEDAPDSVPSGGLAEVCAHTSPIAVGEMLIKSEISDHINTGDPRATGYTLVCASQCPRNLHKTDFFYADGSYAGSVGYYGTFSGNGQPRLYGAAGGAPQHFVSQIAPRADRIGNGMLYMQVSRATGGSTTACKEFNPRGRNGGL